MHFLLWNRPISKKLKSILQKINSKKSVEGEIRTRGSFWDNRLAVYRLTRLGYLHNVVGYGVGILNFWIDLAYLPLRHNYIVITAYNAWIDLITVFFTSSIAWFFIWNLYCKSSLWSDGEWRQQNRYILHRFTRKCEEKHPACICLDLNSNMERQDLRFGAISCTLTFDATNVLLDGAFDNEWAVWQDN